MSGDVTAAIERLATLAGQLVDLEWHQFSDDVLAVLAEVERLRAEVDGWIKTGLNTKWDRDNYAATAQLLRNENARLRAEREALHTPSTRQKVADQIMLHAIYGGREGVLMSAHAREDHEYTDALNAAAAVLSVLTANSEATS